MISVASSIKFRKQDGLMASFDNTMLSERRGEGGLTYLYGHKVYFDDILTIQAKVLNGYTISIWYSQNCWGAWTALAGETLKTNGTVYDYYELALDFHPFANYHSVQFKCEILNGATVEETWISEPCEITTESDDNGLLQVEFFNLENAFEVDYTTEISHLLRVEGQLFEWKPAGEQSTFDNQDEVTKIMGEVKRQLIFRTEPIPAYLAEMLTVACAHDKFFINEVEFVAEGNPDWDGNASTLGVFTVTLTQRNVIGLNTHDIGFDCDSITVTDTMVLQEENASGQTSFTVPEGYLVAYITCYRTAGSPAIIAGTTPGGSEIVSGMNLSSGYTYETASVGYPLSLTGDATVYVTVSGSGATATIFILLLKNRQ